MKSFLLVLAGVMPLAAQNSAITVRTISLPECLEMALKHNFDIRIERYNPKIALTAVTGAEGIYDPSLRMSAGRSYSVSPSQLFALLGRTVDGYESYDDALSVALSGQGPAGFTYSVPLEFHRRFGDRYINNGQFYDEYSGSLSIDMRQPLLKNAAIDLPRRTLMINRKTLKMSEHALRAQLMTVVTSVRVSYLDLIFARESVKVQEKAMELAQRLLSDNKAKVKAGTLPPLDEKQAESQVAMTRADLLTAQQILAAQENTLKNLVVDDLPEWRGVSLSPTEQLVAVPGQFDVVESWRVGLNSRPDLAQMRVDIERYDIDIKYFKNQVKPDLALRGRYGHTTIDDQIGHAMNGVVTDESPFYYFGFELVVPLGNRDAKARYRNIQDQQSQAELRVKKLQQDIMVQIENAITLARSSFDRVDATRQAREYAELAMEAEQKKLENGKSTSFFVLQFQRDLTRARSEEIRALADYNKSLARVSQAEGTALDKLSVDVQVK